VTGPPVQQLHVPELVYLAIASIFALVLIAQFIHLMVLINRKDNTRLGVYRIISLPEKSPSFSFFNLVFLNPAATEPGNGEQVLQHEMAHARQWHSLDILIVQLVKIFQWFNPLVYLLEKALQETHEYLADTAVLEQDDSPDGYRMLLLTQVFGVKPGIFSYFNYSLLKNRLTMMTKQKSPFHNRWKYLATLPVVFILGLFLCCTIVKSQDPVKPAAKTENVSEKQMANIDQNSADEPAFTLVDQQATFQGGNQGAFRKWVQNNLVYPQEAKDNKIEGTYLVYFSVSAIGQVCDIEVRNSINPLLDKEVLRVMKLSPDWIPAKLAGKNVKQQFRIPVAFFLGKNPIEDDIKVTLPAYPIPEVSARFLGGDFDKFRTWVHQSTIYPEEAINKKIQGIVIVQFKINTSGKIGEIELLEGADPILNAEVTRVIKSSPDWEPAKQNGNDVEQQFAMDITFSVM
jgi:TonB family protein